MKILYFYCHRIYNICGTGTDTEKSARDCTVMNFKN